MSSLITTQENLTTTPASVVQAALAQGYAIAAWQLPGSKIRSLLLCEKPVEFSLGQTFENLDTGFIIHPFNRNSQGKYLRADLLFTFSESALLPPELPEENHAHVWLKNTDASTKGDYYEGVAKPIEKPDAQQDFYQLTREALRLIQKGDFEKAVPSRYKVVPLTHSLNPMDLFEKMCRAFPQAFVSLISLPDYGTWIGASPEILVSVKQHTLFHTVALAGTKPYHPGMQVKDVAWTQKEIEEQALVSRYIINCFKKIRLREFEEHGPKTVEAGKLLHLKTEFTVDMKAVNFPLLGSVMLNLLHPTSAVCGMPLEPALQFLQQHEGYDRSLYSGFLGPVNLQGNTDIFVNLRCVQWHKNRLTGYAGCGVTADSVPENEWKESEIKINSLLNEIL
ncbi:MAG: chorismate-binding protein [Cyclobacteriaceae bacterium]|nr:chorismate-binding protein [Cyclobacteriaceae bacterium]